MFSETAHGVPPCLSTEEDTIWSKTVNIIITSST